MQVLYEPQVDFHDLLKEVKGDELLILVDGIRDEIEVFYSKETVTEAVAELNRKQDEEERTLKVLGAISFENKSNEDLVENLKHREEMMRIQALAKLHNKLTSTTEGSNERRELVELCRNNASALASSLKTKKLECLVMAIDLFVSVIEDQHDNFLHALKQSGGFKYFAKLLSSPLLNEDADFLTKLLYVITQIVDVEENRDEFRLVHGVTRLVPFLYHTNTGVVFLASESLLKLSWNKTNKELLVKVGALPQVLLNSKQEDEKIKYESIYLLSSLFQCEQAREVFDRKDFALLLSLLSVDKCYLNDGTIEYKNFITIQKFVLEILYAVASTDRNRYILGQENILNILLEFFKPIVQETYRWDFEILKRVLMVLKNVVEHEINRNTFLDKSQGISMIAQILKNPASYPEDVLMTAADALITLVTKSPKNQALGLKMLLLLYQQFPTQSFVHNLVAMMIDSVAKGENRALVLQEGADKILMTFVRDSRVKEVLVHSCSGLASLCDEVKVVRGIVSNKVVLPLLSLLKLAQLELTRNIAIILAAVAEHSESGLIEIAKRGSSSLVQLLSDDDPVTQEKALASFVKMLSAPASGPENIQRFLQLEGERPLLACLLSTNERVQVPTMNIVIMLSTTTEHREILRDAGIEECLAQLQNTVLARSIAGGLLRTIQNTFKQDASLQGKDDKTDAKRMRIYWLKVMYHTAIKIIPVRLTITYKHFIDMITHEFNIDSWDRITIRNGADEIEVSDQRTLNWILYLLSKDKPVQVDVQHKNPDNTPIDTNKLDSILQRLTHKQLRLLLKEAIDHEAELRESIGQYITVNQTYKRNAKEERLQREPYGRGPDDPEEGSSDIPKTNSSSLFGSNHVSSSGGSANAPLMTSGAPGAPPPPPSGEPPKVTSFKGKSGKPSGGDLMTDMKNALRLGGNLRRVTDIDEDQRKNRGFRVNEKEKLILMGEEAEAGTDLWKKNPKSFIENLCKIITFDYHMAHIIFKIVEKSFITFDTALKMMVQKETVNHETLAVIMVECGFFIKYSIFKPEEDDEIDTVPIKEYSAILCPYDLPFHIILKLTRAFIRTNGINRRGDPLKDTVQNLRELHRSLAKSQEEATQNYWTHHSKSGSGDVGTSPIADIGVVQGYWRQKEQRQVGKLWD